MFQCRLQFVCLNWVVGHGCLCDPETYPLPAEPESSVAWKKLHILATKVELLSWPHLSRLDSLVFLIGKWGAVLHRVHGTRTNLEANEALAKYPVSCLSQDKSLDEVIAILKDHYEPKPIVTGKFRFLSQSQLPGELVAHFIAELWRLLIHCTFDVYLEETLRDHSVCRLHSETMQKQLIAYRICPCPSTPRKGIHQKPVLSKSTDSLPHDASIHPASSRMWLNTHWSADIHTPVLSFRGIRGIEALQQLPWLAWGKLCAAGIVCYCSWLHTG